MEIAIGTHETRGDHATTLEARIDFRLEMGGAECVGMVEYALEIEGLEQRSCIAELVVEIDRADAGLDVEAAKGAIEGAVKKALLEYGAAFFDSEAKAKKALEEALKYYGSGPLRPDLLE